MTPEPSKYASPAAQKTLPAAPLAPRPTVHRKLTKADAAAVLRRQAELVCQGENR